MMQRNVSLLLLSSLNFEVTTILI